jgi:chromate transport protein ChrA
VKNKSETTTLLNGIWLNVFVIFIGTIIAIYVASNTSSAVPSSSNHGAMFPYLNAIMSGIITLLAYLILKNVLKKFSWVITIVGILITVLAATKI